MITHVLRWNGFERVVKSEKPLHDDRIEIAMGSLFSVVTPTPTEEPAFIKLWVFQFAEVDEEGRRIYNATTDPPVV